MSNFDDSFRVGSFILSISVVPNFSRCKSFSSVELIPTGRYVISCMKKIVIILTLLFFCVVMCSSAGCTTIANVLDPVVGSWESENEFSNMNLNMDGTGDLSVGPFKEQITWNSLGNGEYDIGGSRHTLKGTELRGPVFAYHKV